MRIVFGEYVPSREKTEYGKVVTVGVFFDGTLNNHKNTRARKASGLVMKNDPNPTLSTTINKEGTIEKSTGNYSF
ncbi:MAG: hypothetical protein JKY08_03750 [Flavobacteriaceae bacterium]|nr:hypothetical protein [Flavobacteriaceae bacterium]